MWGGPGQDPGGTEGGGTSSDPPSNRELLDLKDQFEQQQVLIAQLKEMLRKTEQTTVTQEKVEEYANTLTRMSARAKKSKLKKEGESETKSEVITTKKTTITVDTPAKEKLMLLRQQVEENKQKLAERGKFQKGIEETVTQLKAQLDDSQQLISQTPLNLSLSESRIENYSASCSQEELFNLLVSKDRRLAELTVKVHKLEGNVLDLQENVKEKDSVIDARTKAITLMTESLSKKGKNTLDALDDTKEQMRKMQENFITIEIDMKNEKQQLVIELQQKNDEINRLQQENNSLQKACNEKQEEITRLNNSTDPDAFSDLNKQIEILNNRIIELEKLNSELQSKPTEISSRDSPQRSSKKGKKGQKLQKTKSKEDDSAELQKMLDNAKVECDKHLGKISEYELNINELNLIIEELKAKAPVQSEVVQASEETAKLKKQLDESNKSMIKIKAQHKGKLKELNKKIDELKKANENTEEISRLQVENSRLSERIDALEEEKANSGLEPSPSSSKDSVATERVRELEIKLLEQSELLENKSQSILTLEEQIKSYKVEIETLNERFEKLSQLENAQVVSEITSIHFEEQLDKLEIEKRELIEEKENIIKEKETLLEKLDTLNKEKQEISNKLDSYMQENMELIDKLEKLSAEKVSSAESIEIVEGLTQQEKLELEAYQKSLEMTSENIKNSDENLEQNPELNESVNQLTEETSDLLRKIELFTEERREVMEKMEALNSDNTQLNLKIQDIESNRDLLAETYEQLQNEKEDLEIQLEQTKEKVKVLETTLSGLEKENITLKENLAAPHHIKHGSEVEEMVKLETVAPLTSAKKEEIVELQNQIDEYKSLVEIQKEEIRDLKMQLMFNKDLSEFNNDLQEKVASLQNQYKSLLSENEKLKQNIKKTSELVHEKDAIESELIAARNRVSEFDEKLTNNLNEIENYKSIVEENKNELISSANLINDLQKKLEEKQNEISHYQNEVAHLNSVITELNVAVSHLENENHQNHENNNAMELMSNQLQELKSLLGENIKQIEIYETELHQNSDTISSLNMQLKELNRRTLELEHDLECKDDEITKLNKERDNKETMIGNLQKELKEKDEKFHSVCDTLKEKYLSLQTQIEQNAGDLDNIKNPLIKVQELETKNKEQLEKMKKIAANLKKKTVAYQELEAKYKQSNEKWEKEEKEKIELQEVVKTQEIKIESLIEQLHEIEKEFASVQAVIPFKTKEIEDLTQDLIRLRIENEELQNMKQNYELQLNAFTTEVEMHRSDESNSLNIEINEKNEIIKNLNQELEAAQYHSQTNSNALQAKIQELEMFIETQETELTKYKDKVNRLEEGLSTVEERRLSLEQKAIDLGAQLQEKSNSYEEISQTEDILEQRLAALMVHDDKIQRHLQETTVENQELIERNRFLIEENNQLKHKLSEATERNIDASTNQEKLSDLQTENLRLNDVIVNIESENKRLHTEYEKKLNEKKDEIEAMEVDLQNQMEQLDGERKNLTVQCEHLTDQIKDYCESQELLKEELEQYKQKLEQQQVDFDAHIHEFQQVTNENKKNLSIIEELNSELSLNKVSEQERIREFQKLLGESNTELEKYQKENLQLHQNQSFVNPEQNKVLEAQLTEFERINSELTKNNTELLEKIRFLEKNQPLDNKITEQAQQAAPEQSTVATFVWPEQSDNNDPFAFVVDPEVSSQNIEPVAQAVTKLNVQNPPSSTLSENTKEELLNKIRTLEFMLYNTEKEKEDVFIQCQELINEIARLIYEKQNVEPLESQICSEKDTVLTPDESEQLKKVEFVQTKDYFDSAQALPVMEEMIEPTDTYLCYKPPLDEQKHLEPQIVSSTDTAMTKEDVKQLKKVEFEKAKSLKKSSNKKPVKEDVLEPKKAYVCYQFEAPPDNTIRDAEDFQHIQMTPLDSQIVPNQEANVTREDLKQLEGVEFEKTKKLTDVTNPQVVLEDVAQSQTGYLCYQPETAQESTSSQAMANLEIFDENDDGWGCAFDEVKLEEAHRQTIDNPLMNQNVNFRIEELDERIHVLEVERERHLEEIKQAQIKSGKLIKKLKEFKALNQKLTSDLKKSDFGGLDDAIQDELQSQVASLEKRIKESKTELEKEKTDRSNLLKKLDVLQSANERMIEMKEKQDIEMISWQRQNRELSAKLEQFEWGNEGFDSPKKEQQQQSESSGVEKKIQELTHTIKELTLDNEELQTMLEEQRTLRINAEKAKSVEPIPENMKTETEYLNIVTEKNNLHEQLISNVEEKKNLQEQLNNVIKNNDELQEKIQGLIEEKSLLEVQISENKNTIEELNTNLHSLQNQTQNALQESKEIQNNELQQAKEVISDLEQKNSELSNRLQSLEAENINLAELRNTLTELNQEKIELFNALQEKNIQIENLKEVDAENDRKREELEEKLKQLQVVVEENKAVEERLQLKDTEISELNIKLETALEERSALSESIQQMTDEWNQRVDQRGADVAESWKLHLDSRETEFAQIEQQLKKEINEAEEKCNALVNENNELRKNVDAEIRNEVDRISALQQQITDRQHYINDLTLVVQENQTKSEQQVQKITEFEGVVKQLTGQIQDKNVRITDTEAKILSLEIEIEEKNKIIEEFVYKLQEFEGLCQQLNGNNEIIASLQRDSNEKQRIIEESKLKLEELAQFKETCVLLQTQMQDKDSYISEITNQLQDIQKNKQTEANNDIQMFQQRINDLNMQLQERQIQIEGLTQQIYTHQEFSESFQVKDVEVNNLKTEITNLTSLLNEKEKLSSELQEKFNVQLKQGIEGKEIEINKLQAELNNLKLMLNEKEKEYSYNLATTSQESESVFHEQAQELDLIKRRQAEAEYHFDELLMAKDSDLENLRIQHQEQVQKNEMLIKDFQEREDTLNEFKIQLDLKEHECEELQNKIFEQNTLHNEENKQLSELREIIEDQVLKIESLKQELFEKSKDYDSLIAELDIRKSSRSEPGTPPYEHREEFSNQTKSSEVTPSKEGDAERANRVELDLALYMLHQRDVRCEELTVELMQLLEERDTLQLKLSNSIREKEDLRSRFLPVSTTPDTTDTGVTKTDTGAIPKTKSKASAIVLGATGTELATEATEMLHQDKDMDSLANKLSELKSVGYRRDKTILDEQEHRQLQQLSLMQQHRDVAAMLPAEAAAQLVQDANYTLSRDVQSPPKVLLNWLWGRSTPKVNNI